MSSIDDITATITIDGQSYTVGMTALANQTKTATDSMGTAFKNCGELLDLAITAPLTALAYKAVDSFNAATQASALMSAEIQTTGDSVGFTSAQLDGFAENLSNVSGIGKTEIMSGVIDSLLKFQNISGITFESASKDAVGWANTGKASVEEASQKIGMALEDPSRAFMLLKSSQANLSETQRDTITQMMQVGNIAGAQDIVLQRLNGTYGKLAVTMGATSTPAKEISSDWAKISENLAPFGGIVERAMVPFLNVVVSISTAFKNASPAMQTFVVITAAVVAAFAPILTGIGFFITTIMPAMAAGWGLITAGAAAFSTALLPITGTVLAVVAALAVLALAGQLIYDNWSSIKSLAKDVWSGVESLVVGALNAITFGGFNLILKAGQYVMDNWNSIKSTAGTVWNWIKATVESAIAGLITAFMKIPGMKILLGDLQTAVGVVGTSITNMKDEAVGAWTTLSDKTKSIVTGMATHVTATMAELWHPPMILAPPPTMVPAWITSFNNIQSGAEVFTKSMVSAFQGVATDIENSLTTGGMDWVKTLGTALQSMLKAVTDWAIQSLFAVSDIADAMNALWEFSPLVAIGVIAGLIGAVSALHMAPAMANGGVFDKATTVTVGEAGPEVILPVTRLSNGKMGVQTQTMGNGGGSSAGGGMLSGGGMSGQGGGDTHVTVMLDSKVFLDMVAKASRTGNVVIHPNAVRKTTVNQG